MKKQHASAAIGALLMGFLLGIHDGRLALWADPDPEPVRVFSLLADALPPADRLLLQRGIRLESEQELYAALEDYL